MARNRSAEAQRAYRARVAAGEQTREQVPPRDPLPPVVVLAPNERAELESQWDVHYRRTISAWLIRQRSAHTRKAYQRAWNRWLSWCRDHDIDPIEPEHGAGGVFISDLRTKGYSEASLTQWRVAIRQGLLELSAAGLRSGGDPFARVAPFPPPGVSTVIPLRDEDVAAMVRAARELGPQHLTAVLMLAVMGVRAFEAGQVGSKTVKRSPWGWVAEITGKGGKRALVPVPEVVRQAALEAGCWPIDGRKGSGYERIRYLVDQVAEHAGLHVSCHQFRHWHATTALREGVPLERVQDSLRHADPATTQRYNRARVVVEGHSAFVIEKLPAIAGV